MSATLDLAMELISRPSVTPEDAGCQELMIARLEKMGFEIERMRFGEVDNFWARRGEQAPLLAFAGHTDVVPTGPLDQWDSDPFRPEIRDGFIYGRGSADMKGSLAAMITACERFITTNAKPEGSIAFLITSDEEGPGVDGTKKVIETLMQRGEHIDWCLVGEPSSDEQVGDVVKNGRRGSLGGKLIVHGTQGHIAYPHLASNPILLFAPVMAELCAFQWDEGNEFFPPTSFQISNIKSGTGADNVIPGDLEALFNFRYSTETTEDQIKDTVESILDRHQLHYDISWKLSGLPFLTSPGTLVNAMRHAIQESTGITTKLSTDGGTSDGRFIAPTGAQVAELGPTNATIHKLNECVRVDDLEKLSLIYERILHNLFVKS